MRVRLLTICIHWRREKIVPELRLCGKWLARNGFEIGRKVAIQEEPGKLTLRLVPAPEAYTPRYQRLMDKRQRPVFPIYDDAPRVPLQIERVAESRENYREELH